MAGESLEDGCRRERLEEDLVRKGGFHVLKLSA
jgi:ADP-ribose pyrophosphatase YjhB (NUDIX family)